MRKAQVLLREDQKAALLRLSHRTGRSQSELVRHGVDLAIAEAEKTPQPKAETPNQDWKKAWLAAIGMWEDRTDLDAIYDDIRRSSRVDRLEEQWRKP